MYWTACVGLGLLAVELLFSSLRQVREIVDPSGVEDDLYGETGSAPMI